MNCPACGQPIDYCQGHGDIGDPAGAWILHRHDEGSHEECHPLGCDEVCPEFTTDGACIHSDHMARAGR